MSSNKKANTKSVGFALAKRAFFLSLISLITSVFMLVGTTYAWLTDSVSSGTNKIVAGNLDIELNIYSPESDSFVPIGDKPLFPVDVAWEPGRVEIAYLEVANIGNLPLNFEFSLQKTLEEEGVNSAGQSFKLSDYLVFQTVKCETEFHDKNQAISLCEGIEKGFFSNRTVKNDTPLAPGAKQYYEIIAYMPDDEGVDEANYTAKAPMMQLNVTLTASQGTIVTTTEPQVSPKD